MIATGDNKEGALADPLPCINFDSRRDQDPLAVGTDITVCRARKPNQNASWSESCLPAR
jgi:hypothetical protein